jgi:hypothetical protein
MGLSRRTQRTWLCASALGTISLVAAGQEPERARQDLESRDGGPRDRPNDDLGPVRREPSYGRAAVEMLGVLSLGTIHYWMNAKSNSADWDFPRWSERWDSTAVRFDNNTPVTNNVLHPLAGAAYYGLSRANGLGVAASASYTLASSAIWEWGLEWREKISINDMIATTVGGVAIGEFMTQLGAYLNSTADDTNAAQDVARATLGFPIWIHDRLDRRQPEPPVGRDNLGFSSTFSHRFTLAYETQWLVQSNDPSLELRGVALDGQLVRLPGFLAPETWATSFAQGNFSTGSLDLRFDGSGLREAEMRFETVLAGFYVQRANPGVLGSLLGLATGIEFTAKDTLQPRDHYALLHLLGPELRAALSWKGYELDVRLRAFADFAAIRSLAWSAVKEKEPEQTYKSSLERQYQYHLGVSSRLAAMLRIHAARVSVEFGLGSYRSLQGLDRFQERITRDLAGAEVLVARRLEFALEPPGTLLRLYGRLDASTHESTLGGQSGERDERRSLIGAGIAF